MKSSLFVFALMASLVCTACSQGAQTSDEPPPPAHSSTASAPAPATSAVKEPVPATTTAASASPATSIYLHDLLQRPDFASALDNLAGAKTLPAWVHQGGVATPAQTVQVDGRPMLLASACKPHDCPSERVAVLYDAQQHAMWGLYAQRPESTPATIDPDDSSHDTLTWLGQPDDAAKEQLHERLYTH